MTQANEIDYDQLKLITSPISNNEEESHEIFMSTYSSIFVPTSHPEAGIPNQPTKSFLQAHPFFRQKPKSRSGLSRATSQSQFDIFTKQNEDDADTRASTASSTSKEALHREQLVSELYQIMLKFPFERNRKEHKRVLEIFVDLAPAELLSSIDAGDQKVVLQNLVHAATRIYYPDAGMTVFGNSGLFMILKGSVRPQAIPYLNLRNWSDNADDNASRTQTPILRKHIKLNAGDCFGTFEQIQGKAHNSKIFSVITREPCELLKISCHDFKRIITKIMGEEQLKKMSVIQSCSSYKNWPNLSLKAIAACVKWQQYLANTIIFNEGEICPFIGFIKSGECEIFKSVDAVKTLPNNRKMKVRQQVCMGVLTIGDSVGETSMLRNEALTCSVVARTDVSMGVIEKEGVEDLDETTRTLLIQSSKPTFANLTEDDIQQNFIAQEMKMDWEKLKHKVLLQTINYCGIRPGFGKWSH